MALFAFQRVDLPNTGISYRAVAAPIRCAYSHTLHGGRGPGGLGAGR
jgi:hypothetical protein